MVVNRDFLQDNKARCFVEFILEWQFFSVIYGSLIVKKTVHGNWTFIFLSMTDLNLSFGNFSKFMAYAEPNIALSIITHTLY